MTSQKTTLKNFAPNRDGITLLFVISMVVLFLLMGTSFMIISNDYFKAARRRSTLSTNIIDPTALLDRCFYEIFRGPALQDVQAPLRGHSILEDQYGYGLVGTLQSIEAVTGTGGATVGGVVELRLDSNTISRMLDPSSNPVNPANSGNADNFFDGRYNGRVVSIVSGTFKGYSGRIISSFYVQPSNDLALQVLVDDNLTTATAAVANNARVIINGRDFAGFGSGNVTGLPTPDSTPSALMGAESLRLNRFGESFADLRANYLQFDNSPNEPYDIADFQNWFLNGASNNVAFHRPKLIAAAGTDQEILASTMRPYYSAGSDFSTANANFPSAYNSAADVDTNVNGVNDAVWNDIGLPTQTDSRGRRFRPLAAYFVLEMDSRLNLHAHGNTADAQVASSTGFATGIGYGPAEVSLNVPTESDLARGAGNDYETLMDLRYGVDDTPGYSGTNSLPETQKLFGSIVEDTSTTPNSFNTGLDLLGTYQVVTDVSVGNNISLPGYRSGVVGSAATDSPSNSPITTFPYLASFATDGSAGESPITALEFEAVLRFGDADALLLTTKLNRSIAFTVGSRIYTPDSFEVNVPATTRSLSERLNDTLVSAGVSNVTTRSNRISSLIPRETMFGGKINLNRPFGNRTDDNGDNIVDNIGEPNSQTTTQNGNPSFETQNARYLMAKDLYVSFLLATGDTVPADFTYTGDASTTQIEYHRMVAQWAVNVVDFRDADSINTPFRFDPTPFDGNPFETTADPTLTVWGCERPEILITETFAFHDRKNVDGNTASTTTDPMPDDDWDSEAVPVSGAILEFYNPWVQPNGFQRAGAEVGGTAGVDLGALTPGNDPVWRVGLKRSRTEADADILRTIFFVDPGTSAARLGKDSFFPNSAAGNLQPGQYAVMKPVSGNSVNVGGDAASPYETINGIGGNVPVFMDSSTNGAGTVVPNRIFSISDPAGGYTTAVPTDQPLDARVDTYRTEADLKAMWVNGIADNFRFAFLQRLANPTIDYDVNTNPYLTVDTAGIDLLGMNSTAPGAVRSNGSPGGENGFDSPTMGTEIVSATDGFTRYKSVERGESHLASMAMATPAAVTAAEITRARQNLFRAEDGPTFPGMGYNMTAGFTHTFGSLNASYNDSSQAVANRTQFGWLSWNNRTFASHMELLNVPYTSPGMLTYLFNEDSGATGPNGGIHQQFRLNVAANFGDERYQHLLRFSEKLGTGLPAAPGSNRFSHFLEFVETQSLFLGTETFLPDDFDHPNLDAINNAEFNPQVHGFPNFRVPGKVNVNQLNVNGGSGTNEVWDNLTQGFPLRANTLQAARSSGNLTTDFKGVFTTGENAMMVTVDPRSGATPTLHSSTFDVDATPATTSDPTNLKKDPAGASYFGNELKQKLGSTATIRSSVYSIWVMVGYFEVDEYGRLGAELATDDGGVQRNRAFYVVDRSIPVACEPGKNHNVDKAVLTRSIIE